MNHRGYQAALEAAENRIDSFRQSLPDALRERAESLFENIVGSRRDRLSSLEWLFSEMDVIYDFVHRFSTCRKGCYHCCRHGISISPLEVRYISRKVDLNTLAINTADSNCPFLVAGVCAIYDHRPFPCRRHLAFYDSPEWCEVDIAHNHRFPNINCTEIDRCYAYLTRPGGRHLLQDIRQAFASPGREDWPPA